MWYLHKHSGSRITGFSSDSAFIPRAGSDVTWRERVILEQPLLHICHSWKGKQHILVWNASNSIMHKNTGTGAITALRRRPAGNYRVPSGYTAAAYAQCEAQLCSLCHSGHKRTQKSLCLLWQKSGNARHSGADGLLAFTPTCQCSANCSKHTLTHTHTPPWCLLFPHLLC